MAKKYRAKKRIILHDMTMVEAGQVFEPTSFSGIEHLIEPVEEYETKVVHNEPKKPLSVSQADQVSTRRTYSRSGTGKSKTRKTTKS
jgi:hypothetical protein